MQKTSDSKAKEISISAVEEINCLHDEMLGWARKSIGHAIRIGELLTLAKSVLKHGEWMTWFDENLHLSLKTGERWMRLFERRDEPEIVKLTNLGEGYRFLYSHNGEVEKEPQKLHEPNFHSQAVRLRQNLVALFNHHLQRRPLRQWHTEEIYDLFCSLKPMTEICSQLELELNTRDDVPASYRQTVAS